MTTVDPADHRGVHKRLASLVAFVASIRLGRHVVTVRPSEKGYMPGSDVRGVPGWSITCRVGPLHQLGEHLDTATLAAEHEGQPHAAVVIPRKGRNLGQAYVTMAYADWLALVAQTTPAPAVEDIEFDQADPTTSTAPLEAPQTAQTADPLSAPGPSASPL